MPIVFQDVRAMRQDDLNDNCQAGVGKRLNQRFYCQHDCQQRSLLTCLQTLFQLLADHLTMSHHLQHVGYIQSGAPGVFISNIVVDQIHQAGLRS